VRDRDAELAVQPDPGRQLAAESAQPDERAIEPRRAEAQLGARAAERDRAGPEPGLRPRGERLLRLVEADQVALADLADPVAAAQPVERGRRELERGLLLPRRPELRARPRPEDGLRVRERDDAELVVDRVVDAPAERPAVDRQRLAPLADPERAEIERRDERLLPDPVVESQPEPAAPLSPDRIRILVDRRVRIRAERGQRVARREPLARDRRRLRERTERREDDVAPGEAGRDCVVVEERAPRLEDPGLVQPLVRHVLVQPEELEERDGAAPDLAVR